MTIDNFQIFYHKLLLSLTPDVPLEENLRALMAPTLSKLKRYFSARVAIHAFVNPVLGELHAMAVGESEQTRHALDEEVAYRHDPGRRGREHRQYLPAYRLYGLGIAGSPNEQLERLRMVFESDDPLPKRLSGREVKWLLVELREHTPQEFSPLTISDDDDVVVLPLGTGDYRRLGSFLLWAPAGQEIEYSDEQLVTFRKSFEQLLIRVLTNFYRMVPHTYLPSYYRAEQKPVALFCAEINGFDRVSEILRRRRDIDRKTAAACLGKLVRTFSRTAAGVVERNEGRVDQYWGSGLLAVFGEHLVSEERSGAQGCMRAVKAAADFVTSFDESAREWLANDFDIRRFREENAEEVRMEPVVAVDYGEVLFDYVGSSQHQSYLAVGDRVDFVKALVRVVGRWESYRTDAESIYRRLLEIIDRGPTRDDGKSEAPIVLSQTAYIWAKDILQERRGEPVGTLDNPSVVSLPGKLMRYPVHLIWPENVRQTS